MAIPSIVRFHCHVLLFAVDFMCCQFWTFLWALHFILGTTEGLMGVYDGDFTNDFTARTGFVYPVISFEGSNGLQNNFGNTCAWPNLVT